MDIIYSWSIVDWLNADRKYGFHHTYTWKSKERRINQNSYEINKNHRQYNQQARLGYRINGGLHSYREEDEIISTYNFFDPSSNNNYFELVFANI